MSAYIPRHSTPSKIKKRSLATDTLVDDVPKSQSVGNDQALSHSDKLHDQSYGAIRTAEKGVVEESDATRVHGLDVRISKVPVRLQAFDEASAKERVKRIIRLRKQAQKDARLKTLVRKTYQESRREEKGSWIPDWRVILGDLRKATPRHVGWFDKAVSISVPETEAQTLLHGDEDNSIWEIAARHDCSVVFTGPKFAKGPQNEVILSGSGVAIRKTVGDAMRNAPGSKVKDLRQKFSATTNFSTTAQSGATNAELDGGPTIRFVNLQPRSATAATRVDDIERPSKWTTRSFMGYVEQLTSMRMPNHKHHLLYEKGEEHVETVSETLRHLFRNPECKSALSRKAFKTALAYFTKTNSITDVRAIFVLMETANVEMDAETFNIMLRGAAKNDDLHNYHFILHLMLRRGITPNGMTWVAFLMSNYDFLIKQHIVAEMKSLGLLSHPGTLLRICQELVVGEVYLSLDHGQSLNAFVEKMDSSYGKDWLSVDTGNRVLNVLAGRGLISLCWEFLQIMNSRSRSKFDHVSVNTILNACKQQNNVAGALDIMKLLPSLNTYRPDQSTYYALFELAWGRRSYNFTRVVWKYACLNAGTTARMRNRVAQSLIQARTANKPEASQLGRWKQQAGFVITNDVYDHPISLLKSRSNENTSQPPLAPQLREATNHGEAVRAVSKHLACDYEVFKIWKPARPFVDMLMEAWELDREWQRDRMRSAGGDQIDWKVQEAIPVPVLTIRSEERNLSLNWC